jgi:hypothetical protein
MAYAFGIGLTNAAFTSMVLVALNRSAAATGYNIFVSLTAFPVWWLGLFLGWVADHRGPRTMLWTEAAFGLAAIAIYFVANRMSRLRHS